MIVLSLPDIEFMLTKLPLPSHLKSELERLSHDADWAVSDDVADELRDLCTGTLDTHGFDSDYMPTKDGERLEELIDKLFIG